MLDPTADAKRANYSRQDESARRLWNTQLGKVNPWEQRGRPLEDDAETASAPESPQPAPAEEAPSTMIEQQDRLRLQQPPTAVDNPFESLIENRLQLKLTKR